MSTATTFIPAFATITLLMGGFNELSIQLTLVGIFAIILHTAITPTDLPGPYPNFGNYHPTQPPFRDYVLAFGLASLGFVALFSRIYSSLRSFARGQLSLKVRDTRVYSDPRPTPRSPSPSYTSADQWNATASTLTVESPAPIAPQATGPREVAGSETIALMLRVSQLEAAMEDLRHRLGALNTGKQGVDATFDIATTVATKPLPTHTPAPPLNPDTTFPPPTQPPSPSPIDPKSTPLAALKPVDTTVDAREHLRSLVGFIMEGTRQTDQLIHEMRNILTEADTTNDTTFNACKDEDDVPPVPSPSTSMQILREYLPPSSETTSLDPSPYSSPISSPSTRLDQALKTPIIHRVNFISPLSPAAKQMSETTQGSPGTPGFDLTLDLDFSQAPCSTPLQSAEVKKSILPPPSSFLRVLESDFDPRDLFSVPAFKCVKEADTRAHSPNKATPSPTKILPQVSAPRHKRDFVSRVRERSSKALYPPPSSAGIEPSPDARRNAKGKNKAVEALQGMSDWLAERRRMRKVPRVPPLVLKSSGMNA